MAAVLNAIKIPLKVMEVSLASMNLIEKLVETGNPNSISDVGVAALCARSAVIGAFLNVKINCKDYQDKSFVKDILKQGKEIVDKACKKEKEILKITESKI